VTGPITRARLVTLPPGEAAALWRVQKDEGLPVEAGLFEEWLAESDANRAAWDAVERAWSLFDAADDPAFAALREAALARRGESRWGGLREHWRAAAAAAVLALAAGGIQLLHAPAGPVPAGGGAASGGQIYAAAGSAGSFTLADGTRMTLEPGARATVAYAADTRRVFLDRGSATFAVTHDASRPFAVAALDRTIVDLGTRFQVSLEGDALRVALFEGSVRVEAASGATVLRPGEQLLASPGGRDVVSRIAPAGAPRPEVVEFDNVTLASAAEMINRGSAVKLIVTDPKAAGLRVSGRFRVRDAERFARTVAELLSLRVVRVSPSRIELRHAR